MSLWDLWLMADRAARGLLNHPFSVLPQPLDLLEIIENTKVLQGFALCHRPLSLRLSETWLLEMGGFWKGLGSSEDHWALGKEVPRGFRRSPRGFQGAFLELREAVWEAPGGPQEASGDPREPPSGHWRLQEAPQGGSEGLK